MSVATTATGSDAASDVLSRMDAAIASMKECRKEFATALSKSVRKEATKARNALKRKEKKEAEASGVPLPPKERTSAWQAFSAGDEVHGVLPAKDAYKPQYDAWLLTQPNAKQALTGFAKFARTADFGSADYAALEVRYKALAAERKSAPPSASPSVSTTPSKRKGKLTEEEKEANKAARHEETLKRRAAKAAEKAAEKAASTPVKAKAPAKAPAAPTKAPKPEEEKLSSSSSSVKRKLVPAEEKPKGKAALKLKAAPPPPPPKDDEVSEFKPYKYKGRTVLRTEDNYLLERLEDGSFGDFIGLLGEDGEVDTEVANPFEVDE
jgi:hypothetical protein